MKKVLLSTWIIGVGIAVGVGLISLYGVGDTKEALGQALRVITAPQGGTGISTSSPTDVGKCIMVLDDSPFTYKLDDCGGLGSDPTVIQVDGAAQSVDSPTLNYTSNSFTVVENPDDTFTLRVATTTLGLLTTNVGEGSNLYYTDVRARAAITESVLGLEFNSGVLGTTTGYFVPTTTRAGTWDTAYSWGNHALASYLTTVDISSNTNLTADGTNVVLTGDALSLGSNLLLSYASSTGFTTNNLTASSATATNLYANNYYGNAENLSLARIGNSTYSTVQHLQNIFHSSGYVSGGAITEATPSTVNVAAGTGLIRDTNSGVATVYYFDWAASTSIPITSNTITYIGVDYNSGSPTVIKKTTRDWNFKTQFELGQVVTDGTDIHISNVPDAVGDHAMNMVQRMYDEMKVARDASTGGLILSETGTRNLSLSAGNLWIKLTKIPISASSTLSWDSYYGSDGGGWNEVFSTQWDNTQYDNAGTLTSMTAGRWGVHWFYIESDGRIVMRYSPAQYTSQAAAEAAMAPSELPDRVDMDGRLFAKLVYQRAAGTGEIFTLWDAMNLTGTAASDHGSLSGLTDDDHTQYLLASGARSLTAGWNVGGFPIYGASGLQVTSSSTLAYASSTALTVSGQTYLGYASSTGISGTNVNFTNGVVTYATSTNLAATTVFNFLGTIITNVATWFSTTLNAVSSFVAAASSTWDFGGATSLELPNGTGPTVDATGEIALDTTSDQVKFYGASSAKVLGNGNDYSTFTYATTTAWTGTTTIPLGVAIVAETWNAISCFTDAGTLNIGVGDGTNWTNNTAASTTAGLTTLTSNNTFTALEKRYVRMGTPSGAPTTTSCTISRSLTAD